MSNDEHERELGRLVLKLREKEVKQHCLRDKANGLSQILKAVMKLHEQQQHELDKLPEDCQIVGTFRSLVEVKAEIENLKNNLCLKWND
jgi:hypothetical protein